MPLDYDADAPEPEFGTEVPNESQESDPVERDGDQTSGSPSDNLDREQEPYILPGMPQPKVEGVDYWCEVGNVEKTEAKRFNDETDIAHSARKVEQASAMSNDSGPLQVAAKHLQMTDDSPARDEAFTDAFVHHKPEPYFDRYPPVETDDPLEEDSSAPESGPPVGGTTDGGGVEEGGTGVSPGRGDRPAELSQGILPERPDSAVSELPRQPGQPGGPPEDWDGENWNAREGTLIHGDIEAEVEDAFMGMGNAPDVYSEYPAYKLSDNGEMLGEGRIDTLVEWQDRVDVVDYKTNQMWTLDANSAERLGTEHGESVRQYTNFASESSEKPADGYLVMMGHTSDGPRVREAYEQGASRAGVQVIWAESGDRQAVAKQLRQHLTSRRE